MIWLGWLVSEFLGSAYLYFPYTGITSARHHVWLFIWVLRMELRSSCRTDSHFLCPDSVSILFLQTREGRSRKDAQMGSSSPRELSLRHVSRPISRGWQHGRVGKEKDNSAVGDCDSGTSDVTDYPFCSHTSWHS